MPKGKDSGGSREHWKWEGECPDPANCSGNWKKNTKNMMYSFTSEGEVARKVAHHLCMGWTHKGIKSHNQALEMVMRHLEKDPNCIAHYTETEAERKEYREWVNKKSDEELGDDGVEEALRSVVDEEVEEALAEAADPSPKEAETTSKASSVLPAPPPKRHDSHSRQVPSHSRQVAATTSHGKNVGSQEGARYSW